MNNNIQTKSGVVTLAGRPNVGKSTLLNNIIGIKVAITSPRPQTTRFPIRAVLQEARGQIVFVDTPGVFAKYEDTLSVTVSKLSESSIRDAGDVLVYMVDITRPRGLEENRLLGIVRKVDVPKVLVMNKIDKKGLNYKYEYEYLREEFEHVIELSALVGTNVSDFISLLFELLPNQEPIIPPEEIETPLVNLDRRMYLEELIREKVFLNIRQEIPYATTVRVLDIKDKGETLVITAEIVTSVAKYKGMIIGKGGMKIKEIGQAVRKELETVTNRKVHVDLKVVVDPHWVQEWM